MPPVEPKGDVRIMPVLRAYIRASLRYPGVLTLTLAGVLGSQAAVIISPLYLGQFIDTLASAPASPSTVHALLLILAAFAGASAVGWVAYRLQTVSTMRIEADVMADLEGDAFANLIRQDYDFFTSNFSGTLTR